MIIKLTPTAKNTRSDMSCNSNSYSHLCSSNSNTSSSFNEAVNNTKRAHIGKEKKKITRTKTGCLCCRRRKKKCDEKKPGCSGCVRNNLECLYPVQAVSKPKTSSPGKFKKSDICYLPYNTSLRSSETNSLACVPSSPTQPSLSSPDSANSSDSESPLASPKLQPFSLNLPVTGNNDAKVSFLSINSINYNAGLFKSHESKSTKHISVKSLLN